MVKAISTALVTINKVVEASFVYYREGHSFNSSPENHTLVNYIGNYNKNNQNNPYSNIYNLRLR